MAAFSFNEFYQRNRRVVIWVILFLLLWALRDFFAVVFLSFVLAIIAAPFAEIGMRRLRLPHWAAVTVVYVIFLGVLGSFVAFVVPSVVTEVNRMIENLPCDRGDGDRNQEPARPAAIRRCGSRSTATCAARSPTISSQFVELELDRRAAAPRPHGGDARGGGRKRRAFRRARSPSTSIDRISCC